MAKRRAGGPARPQHELSEAPLFTAPGADIPQPAQTPFAPPDKDETPHYAGHRERLRDRFKKTGGAGLADYELLELLLFRVIPRRDVKPLAKDLLKRFDGLSGVMAAPVSRLMEVDGVSEATAIEFKILQAAFELAGREEASRKDVISSWTALLSYCKRALRHETHEQFRVLYLDRRNQLLADEVLNRGTVDHAPVYPREVARRALEVAASSVILVHNHPSGDPTPSKADVEMTKLVVNATAAIGVTVHDHLVIGSNFTASFKALGLM